MFTVHSYTIAMVMCIITMMCWGSWANATKLVDGKRWPFQLFYWDYAIGILLFSLVLAFTAGSMGQEGRPFILDLHQADWNNLGSALLGGSSLTCPTFCWLPPSISQAWPLRSRSGWDWPWFLG
ncbi:hypothetical protein [Dongshaea marina]|uniref:hypothetical protein n=1 Tax=Dongshaea marina TaxID=2047966 RepID=UPI001F4825A8|nr:hypothetical protein [Dongshaea marina]